MEDAALSRAGGATGHPLEVLDRPPHAVHLGPYECQIGMAFEDAAHDKVAHCETGPQLEIDPLNTSGLLLFTGRQVGSPGPLLLVEREAEFRRGTP